MQKYRTRFVMCAHGLTEAQTQALCTLIWGMY
jgi:hypothetical protein